MNVIVVMLDSLRADHLGCYGNTWIRTPQIDAFARESAIFDLAYAEGLPTIPVRTALFTGRYTLPFRRWQPLENKDVLLAEVLWDKGYRSALISDTYHMHKPGMGFGRGFDQVIWIRGQETDPYILDESIQVDLNKYSRRDRSAAYEGDSDEEAEKKLRQYLRNTAHWKGEEDHFVAQVMTAASNWLQSQVSSGRDDRLFLWVDSFDPHEPWDPPSPYREMYAVEEYSGPPIIWAGGLAEDWTIEELRHYRAQYAGEVSMVDHWFGVLLETVESLGLLENTMVVLLSDHGEPLGEHGIVKKVRPWPYEELSHIPLVIRPPDSMGITPHRCSHFASTPDIMPTILDFLGVNAPSVVQGKSLIEAISGGDGEATFAISGHYGRSWSIRNDEWSFYIWPSSEAPYTWGIGYAKLASHGKGPELYRIDRSFVPSKPAKWLRGLSAEVENVIEENEDIARSMELELRRFIQSLSPSEGDIQAQHSARSKHL